MKKKIVISVFSALILITALIFFKVGLDSHIYDMEHPEEVGFLAGLGVIIAIFYGSFVIFYELDLFYTVYYFFVKQRTKAKSILNVLANLSLLMVIVYTYLSEAIMALRVFELTPIFWFFILYLIFRIAYVIVSRVPSIKETKINSTEANQDADVIEEHI